MKKKTICLLALCALCAGATAQTVTVANVEALPGETVWMTLDLADGKADTYTSLQFTATFPTTGFTTTGGYAISSQWKNASATVGDVFADGTAIVPVSSAEAISGTDVEGLFSMAFTVDASVDLGEYDVTLSNITFGYGFTDKDTAPDVTFHVNVVAAHTVVLDENSTTAPEAAEGVNVRVLRTINAGEWSTICLPFAMTGEQTKKAFGDDVQLADFTGCETEYDDEENVLSMKVNFSEVDVIEANHPYIIKVSQAMTEFIVDGVDIEVEEEPSVDCDEWRTGSGTKKDPYVYHYNSFVGTYVAMTEVPALTLFLSGNQFWYSTGLTKMKAFRGYFDFYDVLTSVEEGDYSSRITMNFGDGETTTVQPVAAEQQLRGQAVYDLQGRSLTNGMLKKGLYIDNGKKKIAK